MKDEGLDRILKLIDEQAITCAIFDEFITESSSKTVRDRVHRKTRKSPAARHSDNVTGRSPFSAGKFSVAERTHPKLKPDGQMDHGAAASGHRRSTKTQRAKSALNKPAVEVIKGSK